MLTRFAGIATLESQRLGVGSFDNLIYSAKIQMRIKMWRKTALSMLEDQSGGRAPGVYKRLFHAAQRAPDAPTKPVTYTKAEQLIYPLRPQIKTSFWMKLDLQ